MRRLRNLDRAFGLPLLRFLVERGLLGAWSGPRRLTYAMFGRRLRLIAPFIDHDFYVRQQVGGPSRSAANRDAILHYVAVGRFHNLAPNPNFDPIAYRETNTHLSWAQDPLSDCVAGRGRLPSRPTQGSSSPGGWAGTLTTLHHGRGGGSAHYLDLLEADYRHRGHRVIRLTRVSLAQPLFRPVDTANGTALGPVFDLVAEAEKLTGSLAVFGATRLVVNHVVDLPATALSIIAEACRQAHVPFDVHVHDFIYLCPRINLVDADDRYCGAPPSRPCRGCVAQIPGQPLMSRTAWRARAQAFLHDADRVFVPSQDTADRYVRHWPEIDFQVRRPESDDGIDSPRAPSLGPDEPVRLAVLGRLNVPKGFDVVLALTKHIRRHRLPIRLILIGQSIDDKALRRLGATVHGRYRPDEANALLEHYAPHLVFFPAIWPETWSFVLSLALRARIPVCAFEIGAIAERLRALRFGHLLPSGLAARPDLLANYLMAIVRDNARQVGPAAVSSRGIG